MNTLPIPAQHCIQSGIIQEIYAIAESAINSMPFPIQDASQHRISDIVTDASINWALIVPFDTEARWSVSMAESASGAAFQNSIALMVPQHSELYSALVRNCLNQNLVFIIKDQVSGNYLVMGSKNEPLRMQLTAGNDAVATSPGFDIVFNGAASMLPYHYTGTATHPAGDKSYLKTWS